LKSHYRATKESLIAGVSYSSEEIFSNMKEDLKKNPQKNYKKFDKDTALGIFKPNTKSIKSMTIDFQGDNRSSTLRKRRGFSS
jgi:hypothetical protein